MGRITRICKVARAKLNLALHITGKRADGYHELDSIFVHCVDGDELWVEPADTLSLTLTGPFAAGLSAGEDNLVLRAARAVHQAFRRDEPKPAVEMRFEIGASNASPMRVTERDIVRHHYGASRGAAITLVKNLPVASGIGGGSADAAATIDLLTELWELPDDAAILTPLAAELGADVAPCMHPWPKRITGRGEDFAMLHDRAYRDWPVLLVNPLVALSTADVFARWNGVVGSSLPSGLFGDVLEFGRNDLEPAARMLAPVIGDVLQALAAQPGAIGPRMSGSGATCFALFGSAAERDRAAYAIAAARPGWWHLATRLS